MMPRAKFTVVIPCYQAVRFLPETLACIPSCIKVIAVDDASTDATKDILRAWQFKDPSSRSVVTHSENQGLGATRNTGWQAASTPWIVFLDADDILEDGWDEALSAFLQSQASEQRWLWHPYTEWDGLHSPRLRRTDLILHASDLITQRLPLSPSGSILHRSVLEDLGGWSTDRHLVEDIDLWMRLWQSGHRPQAWSTTPWTRYRTNVGLTKDVESHAKRVLGRLDEFVARGWVSLADRKQAEAEIWRQVGRTHHKAGRWLLARDAYALAPPSFKTVLFLALTYLRVTR